MREHLAALKRNLTLASTPINASYREEDRQIRMRDGVLITLRIHSPKATPKEGCPGLVIWHGGGFCLGNCDNEVALCRNWTELGGVVVNVDYRLAPENPFPKAVEDAYDSLLWASISITFTFTKLM
jgi:acetyl esterase/lipase